MEIIVLNADDDIVSVCDRLSWSDQQRILLVLTGREDVLRNGMDLVRIRRHTDRLRIEVGLVTADSKVRRQAKRLGIPAFPTVKTARRNRRGWWRSRRRHERVGLPIVGGHRFDDWQLSDDEKDGPNAPPRVSRRHWLLRYTAIVLFLVAMAFLYIIFSYRLPKATIILRPKAVPLQVAEQLAADPALNSVDYEDARVPGRLLAVTQTWQAETSTTGTAFVPTAPARGAVVFVNLSDEPWNVPVGTQVSTSDGGVSFQTIEPLRIAGVVSSTAEISVVALEPGPTANVAEETVNRIEGPLADVLKVSNPDPMSGGELREVAVVTGEDMARLRSQVLQFLQAVAMAEMDAQLTEREFLARESLQVAEVNYEIYSHSAGEQTDQLRLKMEALVQGVVVDLTLVSGFMYEALSAAVPEEHHLVAGTVTFEREEVLGLDEQGRVQFVVSGHALASAELELNEILSTIGGQSPDRAVAYLYQQLPLREVPQVVVWPDWFDRVPYRPERIETTVVTDE